MNVWIVRMVNVMNLTNACKSKNETKIFLLHTGCGSHFGNPTNFKILKEPLIVQKQTIHRQKGLDLSYLEPEGQGRGIIMRA